jgi:hypothetical protein
LIVDHLSMLIFWLSIVFYFFTIFFFFFFLLLLGFVSFILWVSWC